MARFDARSERNLAKLHPQLQKVMVDACKTYNFIISDSSRNEIDQNKAYRMGFSRVKFGQSAHNWSPSLAADCYPSPFNANESRSKMIELYQVIKQSAKNVGVSIRQGADFDRDGNLKNDQWVDLPHVELCPWLEYSKTCKPYNG